MEANTKPDNYIVNGLNAKMNYYVSQHQIIDLETNIPLQAASNNSLAGKGIGRKYAEQRKIYEDSSRSLSIDHPNLLNFPLSRMDLLFWHNVVQLGEDAQTIQKNISLSHFNVVYNGYSLFHYFNDNVDVIEMIHNKFKTKMEEGTLRVDEVKVPLIMLLPDKDGKTALDLSMDNQRPRSFEMMIDLLVDFPDMCLSKALMSSTQQMVETASEIIKNYFHATYQPALMQNALIIPWPDHLEEHIFASPTSLLDAMLLIDILHEENHLTDNDLQQLK